MELIQQHKHSLHDIFMKNMDPLTRLLVGNHPVKKDGVKSWLVQKFDKQYISKAMPEVRYAFKFKAFKPSYTVTANHIHILTLKNREEAERMADNIKGAVYLFHNNEALCVYSYLDKERK